MVRLSAPFVVALMVHPLAGLGAAPTVLPSNLEAAPVFRRVLAAMLHSSPAFRRQCRRVSAGPGLQVSVLVEAPPGRPRSIRARTVLTHQDGLLRSAQVYLEPSVDAAELIAHELEHVLEQLDGIDLGAQAGNGAVWDSGNGSFETRRAIEAGRQVAREMTMGSDVSDNRHRPLEDHGGRVATAAQRDGRATPSSVRSARVSGNGRHVVFVSSARLVEADRNQHLDVYVLDLATGRSTLESVGPGASPANGDSVSPGISEDGRYLTFESGAGNLTGIPFLPRTFHVFLRDRQAGTTRLLTTSLNGQPANGASGNATMSADGTAVAFESTASDLIATPEVARGSFGIYLIQLASGRRARLDVSSAGRQGAGQSMSPSISADGRLVAFVSKADLTCSEEPTCVSEAADRNGVADIYVRDVETNNTRRITRGYAGGDPNGRSYDPAISSGGRHVAFVSEASNLTRDSGSRASHIYVHDLVTGITELVSRTPGGRPANGASLRPALSHDGSRVAFQSLASNLICETRCQGGARDINLLWDVFMLDRSTRRTTRVSTDIGEEWMENSRAPALDASGQVIAFGSRHPIDARDEAYDEDLYVYKLRDANTAAQSTNSGGERRRRSGRRPPVRLPDLRSTPRTGSAAGPGRRASAPRGRSACPWAARKKTPR